MANVLKYIRSLMMIIVCINPIMMVASERFPVPPLYGASAGIGFVYGSNNYTFDRMFLSFAHNKQQIIIIATGIIVLSIACYMYQQNTLGKVKSAALQEMHLYIESLQKKMDACIDKFPGCPEVVKKYFKETISKSIAEHIANIRNSSLRYIKKNKKYFISLTAAPVGMALSYPVTGGAVAMLGVVYGAIQSAREEIAEFRKETEKLFAETNKNIKDGFENSAQNAENNKNEVLKTIQQEVSGLAHQIKAITTSIDELKSDLGNKVDGASEKAEKLSEDLGKITLQMVSLHNKIDTRNEKDDARDEQFSELIKNLENATNQFNQSKTDFIGLVEELIKKSDEKSAEEFRKINEAMSKIEGNNKDQVEELQKIQTQISQLLDKQETEEKVFTDLLDTIKSSNISLEETKVKVTQQDQALNILQNTLEKVQNNIENNKDELLKSIKTSIHQCADLSERMTKLELKVESSEQYNKEMFEKLMEQNKKLQVHLSLLEQKMIELVENHKKENENLRKNLKENADRLSAEVKAEVKNVGEDIKSEIRNNSQSQIIYLPSSENLKQLEDKFSNSSTEILEEKSDISPWNLVCNFLPYK